MTLFAPAAFYVKGKSARLVAAAFGFGHFGEQIAYVRKDARVGGGVGSRCFADGALVHDDDFVYIFQPFDGFVFAGGVLGAVEFLREGFVQNLMDERALARTRYARHANKFAQGEFDIDIF